MGAMLTPRPVPARAAASWAAGAGWDLRSLCTMACAVANCACHCAPYSAHEVRTKCARSAHIVHALRTVRAQYVHYTCTMCALCVHIFNSYTATTAPRAPRGAWGGLEGGQGRLKSPQGAPGGAGCARKYLRVFVAVVRGWADVWGERPGGGAPRCPQGGPRGL